MNNVKKINENAAEIAAETIAAAEPTTDTAALETATAGNTGIYTHTFKKPFTYEDKTYKTLEFDFESLSGRDMIAIEAEMQANSEYPLAPEISTSFQSKMAARAAGIGSDVIEAMSINDFNRITGAARRFLLDTGY